MAARMAEGIDVVRGSGNVFRDFDYPDADERVYLPAAEMLRQLGFRMIRLLTNNPDKVAALERYGIRIAERVPHVFPANGHNEHYLRTKATRSGHLL